jgi:tetratricopeptide (TPR) repeat protein
MNTKPIFIILIFLLGFTTANTQNKTSPREMFLEAESYFLYEEYTEALPLYIQLSIFYPDNDNINYKLGRCYLNIPHEKEKSIDFLENAAKNINPRYKGDNLKETAAPPDVVFYLGDAYRINNQLDKAIAYYRQFKQTSDPAVFDHDMIEDQIRSCENAKKLLKQPIPVEYVNMGEVINSRFSESNPVISGDETVLVYSVQLQFYTAVYFTKKATQSLSPTHRH